jgi:hypothetical protein
MYIRSAQVVAQAISLRGNGSAARVTQRPGGRRAGEKALRLLFRGEGDEVYPFQLGERFGRRRDLRQMPAVLLL